MVIGRVGSPEKRTCDGLEEIGIPPWEGWPTRIDCFDIAVAGWLERLDEVSFYDATRRHGEGGWIG